MTEAEQLRSENAELRQRLDAVDAVLVELRAEALQRRAEIRAIAEALPAEVSRRALLSASWRDAVRHPDAAGVVRRAGRQAGRMPAKALRRLAGRE